MSRLDPAVTSAAQRIAGHTGPIIKLVVVRAAVGCDQSVPLGPWPLA